MSLQSFSDWLSATPVSVWFQTVTWIIPTVQTIHILCIAVVVSAVLLIHLRTLGMAMRSQSPAALAKRFLPWVWCALVVLLVSGAVLLTAEPGRSLPNNVFQLKMSMLVVVIVLTMLYQRPLRHDPSYWEKSGGRRTGATAIAIVSLILWTGIVFAGRWIAYSIGS